MATAAIAHPPRIQFWVGLFKKLALLEPGIVLILIMLEIWAYRGKNSLPKLLILLVMLTGWIVRKEGLRELGLVNIFCAGPVLAILAGKIMFRGISPDRKTLLGFAIFAVGYFAWALFQQLILNGFFAKRLRGCGIPEKSVRVWAGCIFSLAHAPNPILMPATFFGGIAASHVFLRMKPKNLYWLALAQTAITILLLQAMPAVWHHRFAVGPVFWKS